MPSYGSPALTWHKSSYSSSNGGDCVEVATNCPNAVPVRDSKDPHGPTLTFTPTAWTAFLTTLKSHHLPTS
ncbi:DUF397 domain-containing protein [Streptomyces sp. CBMA29]|uniref:DUF397 domain-containing protein n=1 Tax=Streptomyces sp. CBMA29 TaxID=1896314 RepID=UPI001661C1C8|nr:DUF397 domain-containing protein [Streptomyces sp. CBMA29]